MTTLRVILDSLIHYCAKEKYLILDFQAYMPAQKAVCYTLCSYTKY